jgi:uncharacterized protein Yka (UPF0111/DUF47 family)
MRFNTLFNRLVPHEHKFYPLLSGMATNICQASNLLPQLTQATPEQYKDFCSQIKLLETECDHLLSRLFEELNQTFITPFDREDINALGEELDNVMDSINSVAKRTVMYQPPLLPPQSLTLATLLQQSCYLVQQAIDYLPAMQRHRKAIKDICVQLHTLEHQADDTYELFVINIFNTETNAIQLIKLKEILQEMERATDCTDSVGKIIKTIIVKYA